MALEPAEGAEQEAARGAGLHGQVDEHVDQRVAS